MLTDVKDYIGRRAMWRKLHGFELGRIEGWNEYDSTFRASVAGKIATVYPADIVKVY